MPNRRTSSQVTRNAAAARARIVELLTQDHRRIKLAYREFQRLDAGRHGDLRESLVRRTLSLLRVHATLEKELLYPLLRPVVGEAEPVDRAEVEHEIVRSLGEQLDGSGAVDDKPWARFTVLCDYMVHHVKEEEGALFPLLKRVRLDWEGLCADFMERREALLAEEGCDSLAGVYGQLPADFADVPTSSPEIVRHPRHVASIGSYRGFGDPIQKRIR